MRSILLILMVCVSGCSSAQKVDWTSLATDATPTIKEGKCGPELEWTKDLAIYTTGVEVVGSLVVRKKCSTPAQ